jgi:choline dehydrogenase-like flavoprotein
VSPVAFEPEFIVVGSGAGGGTVAARLAEDGFRVLVLEAGGDPRQLSGANPISGGANALPDDYDVPGFHPFSTENDALKWDFFVRHYASQDQQTRDPNYLAEYGGQPVDGVWYPRAGTLGGCTAHNAMIFVAPPATDWDLIADLTGDPSWRGDQMRAWFEKLENCRYLPLARAARHFGNPTGHGWNGWLTTELFDPGDAIRDTSLLAVIIKSAIAAVREVSGAIGTDDEVGLRDPNDWKVVRGSIPGLRFTPLTTRHRARAGTRERLLEVQDAHPDRLKIELNALVTRVLFDNQKRAIGVEYLKGERLYSAHANASPNPGATGVKHVANASREVILAGGAFNTPQLLMLSGIGDPDELARHGIAVVEPLPGVGRNLQDRYEVAVVNRMKFDWKSLKGATFRSGDPQYLEWKKKQDGIYTSNGAIVSVVAPSGPGRPVPDLFLYAVIAKFDGYRPGYSTDVAARKNVLTWVVLKGQTNNRAGRVTLRSANAWDRPDIHFRYFEEGTDPNGDDLRAVVSGVRLARRLTADLEAHGHIDAEESPGRDKTSDEDLEQFVRNRAWGHHASCTCPIGDRADGGVLTSDFKVHGTTGLRVVDASVFPRIPGLFIVSAVYMIGEKAADVIASQARAE